MWSSDLPLVKPFFSSTHLLLCLLLPHIHRNQPAFSAPIPRAPHAYKLAQAFNNGRNRRDACRYHSQARELKLDNVA